jgi:hypothetical protein
VSLAIMLCSLPQCWAVRKRQFARKHKSAQWLSTWHGIAHAAAR